MNRYRKFIPIVILLVAIDLITKWWVPTLFRPGQRSIPIVPDFFQLTLLHNTGAAFSIGHHAPVWFFVLTALVALGVVGSTASGSGKRGRCGG
jgi:signal peptidase II